MKDPIRPGSDTSVKSCAVVYLNPMLGSFVAAMLQTSHTEKPKFSARIDQMRLRRAIDFPLFSQNSASSGFQSLIHLDMSPPGLRYGSPHCALAMQVPLSLQREVARRSGVNRYGLVAFAGRSYGIGC